MTPIKKIALAALLLTPFTAIPAFAIQFGNNNSNAWSSDGECGDPHFGGSGMADLLFDEDIGRDADDCRSLYNRGAINWR